MQPFKTFIYSVISISVLCLSGCSRTPRGVLSEKQMQAVLTDMQIAEAMIGVDYKTYADSAYKDALYQSVFRKHKITQAVYDSSLVWYGRNLDTYMKVYDRVKVDLEQQIKDLGDVQASAAPGSRQDSVDIWPRRSMLVLKPNAAFNGVVFDIKPPSSYSSGSRFVLGMHVLGLTDDMPNKPEIRISAVQGDTTIIVNDKIFQDGYHETVLQTLPTRQVRRVYGYIRMDNSDKNYFQVTVDSLNLMRYNYKTDFTVQSTDSTQVQPGDSIQVQPVDSIR
ncbi:MAG: DUF4296 domain-containing protein [Tannerellaceae bacterium]|nr:DUF4296 domain-containing protein [Tannerellaceae bacterium]